MASNIKLKRSAVPGRVPTVQDLSLGELAINTYDGKLYLRKSAAGNDTIIDVSSGYTLPPATTSVLGGVKVDGTSITVSQTGVISAGTSAYTINRQVEIANGTTTTYILDVAPKSPDYVEVYVAGVYQKKDTFIAGSGTGTKETFTGNGIQTDFVLSVTPVDASYIEVYLQGILQKDTTSYTLTDDTVYFSEAVPADILVEVIIIDKKSQLILSEAPESGTLVEILTYSPTLNIKKISLLATSPASVFNIGYSVQAGDLYKLVWCGVYQHSDAYTVLDYTLTLDETIPTGDWLELVLITANPIDSTTSTTALTTVAENNDGISADTPIDLNKQVHKLSWTGSYAYTLGPGVEGQMIQLVPGAGVASDIYITVSRLRTVVEGEATVSTNAMYQPFGNVSQFPVVITGIYTDDAWNFSADYTSGTGSGGGTPNLSGYVTLTGSQTLTNKTLTSPTINNPNFNGTFAFESTNTTQPAMTLTASNLGDGVGILRVIGSEPDINFNQVSASPGFNTFTFEYNGAAKLAMGRRNDHSFYITRNDGTWHDNAFVLDHATGVLSVESGISIPSINFTDETTQTTAWTGSVAYANVTGKPTLATVATSGSYADLTNKPTLFDGAYASLTGKPTLFSGSYADLTNKPTIPTTVTVNGTSITLGSSGTVTADATTLTGTTLKSTVVNSSLTSVGTLNGVTSNNANAFVAGDSAISNVALSVPQNAAIRDRTNGSSSIYFDVSNGGTTHGSFQFRSSSSYTNVLTMSPTAFNVSTDAVVTARTPSFGRTAWNAAIDTELTVDDMRFRVSNQGGNFPQVIGNGSSRNLAWTVVAARSGSAVTQTGSTGTIVASNAWTSLYTSGGMDSAGDTYVATLQDKSAGRIYRVTFMRSDNGSTTGYNIIAERLL